MATRRAFLSGALSAALAVPPAAQAQPGSSPPRIAAVLSTSAVAGSVRLSAFRQGMREQGYVDGRDAVIDARSWRGETRPLADLAAELVGLNPAVIVAEGNQTVLALKRATSTVPIVMSVVADPVGSGFAASLPRPGANVTGLSNTAELLSGKRLELLKELVPALTRVTVLRNPENRTHDTFLRETEAAARTLGTTIVALNFGREIDLDAAFDATVRARAEALVVFPQPLGVIHRRRIADLAIRHRVPVMFPSPEAVEQGGLICYGPSHTDLWRRAATYVARILNGARPQDLPIEQPTKFELVVNAGAAKALGLAIPPSLLLRAERVIE
jgi:putative ABC transport system substrate-binding protein